MERRKNANIAILVTILVDSLSEEDRVGVVRRENGGYSEHGDGIDEETAKCIVVGR